MVLSPDARRQMIDRAGSTALKAATEKSKTAPHHLFGVDRLGNWLSTDAWPTDFATAINTAPQRNYWVYEYSGQPMIAQGIPLSVTQVSAAAPVPEPRTVLLIGTGMAVGMRHWRRRQMGAHTLGRGSLNRSPL
jgi:hypothetical protein